MEYFADRCNRYKPDFEGHRSEMLYGLAKRYRMQVNESKLNAFRNLRPQLVSAKALSRQFMHWDYLTEASQLDNSYLAVPLPKGKRCMLVSSEGQALSFSKSGEVLARFISPNMGLFQFDCIYAEGVFFVVDLLIWNSKFYGHMPANSRINTLKDILSRPVALTPYITVCSVHCLEVCTDKVLFYQPDSKYIFGTSSNVLVWKTQNPKIPAQISLYVKKDSQLATLDGYCIGDIDTETFGLRCGDVVLVTIGAVINEEPPRVAGLTVIGKSNTSADLWSKILWKYGKRPSSYDVNHAITHNYKRVKGAEVRITYAKPLLKYKKFFELFVGK